MNVGVSTACFYPQLTEEAVGTIASVGANKCEVFFEAESEYLPEYTSVLNSTLKEHNVKADSFHAFCASFEPHLFSNYQRRQKDAFAVFRKAVEAGAAIGAKYYTFHGDNKRPVPSYQMYGNVFDRLVDIAESYGITLAWENVVWCQSHDPEFISRVLEYTNDDRLRFTFDIKQARRAQTPAKEYLKVMKERIVNVHINDYNETETCLLPWDGIVDYPDFIKNLREYGYDNNLIIEVYRSNFEELWQVEESYNKVLSII